MALFCLSTQGRALQLCPTWSERSLLRQPTPWQSPANFTGSSFCCWRFLLCYEQPPAFCHLTFSKLFFMDLLNDRRAKPSAILQWWTGTYPKPPSNTGLQETSHFWAHLHLFPSTEQKWLNTQQTPGLRTKQTSGKALCLDPEPLFKKIAQVELPRVQIPHIQEEQA